MIDNCSKMIILGFEIIKKTKGKLTQEVRFYGPEGNGL
jgi:hypothetical protein